ncbi:MAG TPA: hypothetical protein PKE54_14975 [Candidatus Obscuribacter sp.]|nr:hypothetical protein [Candidatus Obscuribacter sp.]
MSVFGPWSVPYSSTLLHKSLKGGSALLVALGITLATPVSAQEVPELTEHSTFASSSLASSESGRALSSLSLRSAPALEAARDKAMAALLANPLVKLSQPMRIEIDGNSKQVLLKLYRDNRAGLNDLKIDTVLIAKVLKGALPDSLEKVEVHFFSREDQSSFDTCQVSTFAVDSYGSGLLSQEAVLQCVQHASQRRPSLKRSLQGLSYKQILNGSGVLPGAYEERRRRLRAHLDGLQISGVDVSSYEKQFLQEEDLIRRKQDGEALALIENLEGDLRRTATASSSMQETSRFRAGSTASPPSAFESQAYLRRLNDRKMVSSR